MAAPPSPTTGHSPSLKATKSDAPTAKLDPQASLELRQERLASNKKMVEKYHSMFPKIPTMTSEELVSLWREIDKYQDELDDSQNSDSDDDDNYNRTRTLSEADQPGPLLLLDVRTKAERAVSMLQGALSMDDLETTQWINKYVHHFDGVPKGGIPTIVTYCTIGYRSGREAQWLIDDLSSTFGIEIGKTVHIKNLDGILAYSFIEDAPPLLRPCHKGSSDSFMTRRIHSYGQEWSEAVDPAYETVYFDSKPQKAMRLLQTGFCSAFRMVQHQITKTTTKAKQSAPVAKIARTSIINDDSRVPAKRISATGYTSNESTISPSEA